MTEEPVHPTAVCDAPALGDGATVGAFAYVAGDAIVGERCAVGPHAVVGTGVVLGDDVSVAPSAVLAGGGAPGTTVGPGATIGENATVHPGLVIGRGAVVEPGAVVADSVPPNAAVAGNPARIVEYVGADPTGREDAPRPVGRGGLVVETGVPGVVRHPLMRVDDMRGTLAALEHSELPFVPQRTFSVFDVPSERLRGAHAHRECWQFLVCLTGSLRCVVDDGAHRDEIDLEGADFGLLVPPMVWGTQYRQTRDAVLLVLASLPYDNDDYIRNYDVFLDEVRN